MADWAAQNSPGGEHPTQPRTVSVSSAGAALLDSPGSDDLSADIDRLNAINAQIAELSQSDNDGGYDYEFEEEGEESMIEIIGGEDSIGDMDSFSQSFGDEVNIHPPLYIHLAGSGCLTVCVRSRGRTWGKTQCWM